MLRINIEWDKLHILQPASKKQIHLYLFENNGEVKYIGYSNELSLIKEVSEYLRLFNIGIEEIKIWGGTIQMPEDNLITRDLIESAICLMVNQIKPHYNVVCKSAYYGFCNINVNNHHCPYLPENLNVYNALGYYPQTTVQP